MLRTSLVLVVLLASLASAQPAGSRSASPRSVSPDGRFSLVLPDGWVFGNGGRFVPGNGSVPAMILAVTYRPFQGTTSAFLREFEPSLKATQMVRTSQTQEKTGPATWTLEAWERGASTIQLKVYGRSAMAPESGVILMCGTTPERQPPPEEECQKILSTLRTGPDAQAARAGMQSIGGSGWSAQLPADWVQSPDAPMPLFSSPQRQRAPIFLSVNEMKRNSGRGPADAASQVKQLATVMNATVEAQSPVKTGDTDGIAFRLTFPQKMEPGFMITKSSTLGGRVLGLVCGSTTSANLLEDRKECERVLSSLRWEN